MDTDQQTQASSSGTQSQGGQQQHQDQQQQTTPQPHPQPPTVMFTPNRNQSRNGSSSTTRHRSTAECSLTAIHRDGGYVGGGRTDSGAIVRRQRLPTMLNDAKEAGQITACAPKHLRQRQASLSSLPLRSLANGVPPCAVCGRNTLHTHVHLASDTAFLQAYCRIDYSVVLHAGMDQSPNLLQNLRTNVSAVDNKTTPFY
ncbi:hypothetical protein ACRALDRAFT_2020987 [Sodiomyces alcalophilus JCM 7366]|uniref:uncharacterized protein n=1 Tax=Sodiomyces alcalophilus JCM 7366 TaxID=591952 RepID=UPI0039B686CC